MKYGFQIVCCNTGEVLRVDSLPMNLIRESLLKFVNDSVEIESKAEFVKFELSIKRLPVDGEIAFDFTPKK